MSDLKVLGPIQGGNGNAMSDALTGALIAGINNGNNGGILGGNGNGLLGGVLGFFLGAMINGGWNGGGLFGGGNNNALEQSQNYLMEAINHKGELQTQALQSLANTLNADFNLVQTTFNSLSDKLCTLAGSVRETGMQTQATVERVGSNIVASGNQNTNAIVAGINGGFRDVQGQLCNGFRDIMSQAANFQSQDQMRDCQTKYDIVDAINANGRATIAKMDAIEDARKDREIAELQRKLTQSESEKFIAAYVSQSLAPVMGTLNVITQKVNDIACKQPNTVTLPYSGLTAVPTWQAQVGYDIAGSAIANRFFPSQADEAAGGTAASAAK